MSIIIKDQADIAAMRTACRLAAEVLDYITPYVQTGVTTNTLDKLCHDYMVDVQGAIPAPLNYAPPGHAPYPKSICTSINYQICHGIPSDKPLKKGDIVNIDITVIKDGWHGDTSRMFMVGGESQASIAARRLCRISYEAMWHGILQVKPGARLGDVGHAIQTFSENNGCSVVREFCGHGIGRGFHEEPQVLHYDADDGGVVLQAGMAFTIEPMVNAGDYRIRTMKDGWTVKTKDRSLSAQYEHTIVVTENGCEILTLRKDDTIPAIITHGE